MVVNGGGKVGVPRQPYLPEDPDAKAIALLNRLKSAQPDRFSNTHLRTLQRRAQQWRGIMAKKLAYATAW